MAVINHNECSVISYHTSLSSAHIFEIDISQDDFSCSLAKILTELLLHSIKVFIRMELWNGGKCSPSKPAHVSPPISAPRGVVPVVPLWKICLLILQVLICEIPKPAPLLGIGWWHLLLLRLVWHGVEFRNVPFEAKCDLGQIFTFPLQPCLSGHYEVLWYLLLTVAAGCPKLIPDSCLNWDSNEAENYTHILGI